MIDPKKLVEWLDAKREETLRHVGEPCCEEGGRFGHLYARAGAFDQVKAWIEKQVHGS